MKERKILKIISRLFYFIFCPKLSAVPTSVIFEELPHSRHIKKVEIVTKRLK